MPRLKEAAGASPVPYPIGETVTDLTPRQPDTAPAVYDAATLAVLAAMEEAAEKHLDAIRPLGLNA
jgi:hypothetical protein